MTAPILPSEGLFINRITLRGPEMEALYAHLVARGPCTRAEIEARFVPPLGRGERASNLVVRDALDGLCTLGQVRAEADGTFHAEELSAGRSFKVALLGRLRALPERQSAFMALYEACVRSGRQMFRPDELLNAARATVETDGDWTPEKIRFWRELCSYLGIAAAVDGAVLIAPRGSLLEHLLEECAVGQEQAAAEVFERIDREWAPCMADESKLHAGWAEVLDGLSARRRVRLVLGADAPRNLTATVAGQPRVWSRIQLATADRAE
jgi:hypothetical protein